MLFDVRGKRRRIIQVSYVLLAGAFLVSFVIFYVGSDVNVGGSIFDVFRGGGSNSGLEDRVERYRKRTEANPQDEKAWVRLIDAQFQISRSAGKYDEQTGQPTQEGEKELRKLIQFWETYIDLEPKKVPAGTAKNAVQAYIGINQFGKAVEAQTVVIETKPTSADFYQLAVLSYQAGLTRKGDLAAQRAVDLAPKSERKGVRNRLKDVKEQILAQQVSESQQ